MSYTPKRDLPIFHQEKNTYIPTVLAQGPWYANSLHGSSMMALMAHAAEQFPSDIPRLVSRLTVDMMRAAPMAPLTTEVKVVRGGKNVEFLDIHLLSEGELYIRGSAMRIRVQDVTIEDYFRGIEPFPTLPETNEINFFRPVEGDWVGLKSQAAYGDLGSGTCAAQLFDTQGPVGFSSQSVLIRGNEGAPLRVKEKMLQSEQAS